MIRQTIHFSGRVQGVGFRYTAHAIARRFAIAGYVQNLPDGQVQAVAEGEADHVGAFVTALCERMGRYIDTHFIDESPATGEFGAPEDPDSFDIRY